METSKRPIIIKRRKRHAAPHHGGAWKVAYADFVTAMMAFFMVMWLVASVSKDQRAALFDYFRNPSMEQGKSSKAAPGQQGPGGASTSPIDLGGGLDSPRSIVSPVSGIGAAVTPPADPQQLAAATALAEQALERKRLDALMQDLKEAINQSQALEPFKDQLLLQITPEGLRIQIVDAKNRPMFDLGSSRLKSYTNSILHELTTYLISVPNLLSLTGHTDTTPYVGVSGYTNWELSADRANAARRALISGGLPESRISRVVGLSSSALFNKADPRDPVNRRISIVVMTKAAEEDALRADLAAAGIDIDLQPAVEQQVGATQQTTPALEADIPDAT